MLVSGFLCWFLPPVPLHQSLSFPLGLLGQIGTLRHLVLPETVILYGKHEQQSSHSIGP